MFKNVRRCKGRSVRKAESVPVIDLALTILWDVVSQALQRAANARYVRRHGSCAS